MYILKCKSINGSESLEFEFNEYYGDDMQKTIDMYEGEYLMEIVKPDGGVEDV